jgi:hypothetical protein
MITAARLRAQMTGLQATVDGKDLDPTVRVLAVSLINVLETVVKWQTSDKLLPILSIDEACDDILTAIERAMVT